MTGILARQQEMTDIGLQLSWVLKRAWAAGTMPDAILPGVHHADVGFILTG